MPAVADQAPGPGYPSRVPEPGQRPPDCSDRTAGRPGEIGVGGETPARLAVAPEQHLRDPLRRGLGHAAFPAPPLDARDPDPALIHAERLPGAITEK